jgi:putative phosphoesterase
MRILLVSDIHANRAALDAVHEHADLTLCLGDLVEYGVDPSPCIAWTKRHCQHWVRGNHDHGTAHGVKSIPTNNHGYKYLTSVTRPINRERISEADRSFLATMPLLKYLTLGGVRILMVHATPRDPLDEYAPADVEFWTKRLVGVDAEIICVGHTHRPYALEVNGRLVVNPGSMGCSATAILAPHMPCSTGGTSRCTASNITPTRRCSR